MQVGVSWKGWIEGGTSNRGSPSEVLGGCVVT